MARFGVIGGGFGLYGYLPALHAEGHDIYLPERYRVRLESRGDLQPYLQYVHFCKDEQDVLRQAEGAVIAIRPQDQSKLLTQFDAPHLRYIMLEKPLAATPDEADHALDILDKLGLRYRIGYTLCFTTWARKIVINTQICDALRIDWQFMAHHYANSLNNWKRNVSQGGGALAFFAIHLLALLAERGYTLAEGLEMDSQHNECASFQALLTGETLPPCMVAVDSKASKRLFSIRYEKDSEWHDKIALEEPFAAETRVLGQDSRLTVLTKALQDLVSGSELRPTYYRMIHRLWRQILKCEITSSRSERSQ